VTATSVGPTAGLEGRQLLVLGASGYIGSHVCRIAAEMGADLTATHRRPMREDDRIHDVRYVALDVLTDDLSPVARHETAIWCIGHSDHREAWTNPRRDLEANVLALARFLEVFRGRLVLVSSGAVYHGLKGPIGPTSPLAPLHPYGISKLAAERLALASASSGRLSSLLVLRLFHPFGPGERPTRIIPRLLTRFVTEGERHFRLRGDGRTLMDVQPVESVCRAIVTATTVPSEGLVLDICRGRGRRLLEIVNEVAEAVDVEPVIETDTSAASEVVEFEPDPRPARGLLGVPVDDDLGPAVRAYADQFRPDRLEAAITRTREIAQRGSTSGSAIGTNRKPVDISLIIPCLNEDQNVGALVDKLMRLTAEAGQRTEILIVDDCSDDYTFREALMLSVRYPEVVALHKGLPRGIGNAIRFGLQHAAGKTGAIIMGDNVDPLAAIVDFHRLVAGEGYDLVLLNRHASPKHRKSIPLWPYRVYQAIFRTFCRIGAGLPHRDPTYAFRGFSIDFIRSLDLESGGFEISPEITLKAWLRGARIGELTGAQGRRVAGASNFVFSQQALGFFRVVMKATLARRFGWARRLGMGRNSSWAWHPRDKTTRASRSGQGVPDSMKSESSRERTRV
jgi:nucleoside-diphosphate-sugar epimerase/glycosyltransferase involved in cell wall biosynthesis